MIASILQQMLQNAGVHSNKGEHVIHCEILLSVYFMKESSNVVHCKNQYIMQQSMHDV